MMRLSPINANLVTVNWVPESGKQFIITMNIVEKLSSGFLLNCLKEKPRISVDVTKVTSKLQYNCTIKNTSKYFSLNFSTFIVSLLEFF